jgi:hypothetical protein
LSHKHFLTYLQQQLEQNLYGGRAVADLQMDSTAGAQSIDLAWLSDGQLQLLQGFESVPFAPCICIEFFSSTAPDATTVQKKALLFNHHAEEVWLCDAQGQLTFFNQNGQLNQSRIAPRFQQNIHWQNDE